MLREHDNAGDAIERMRKLTCNYTHDSAADRIARQGPCFGLHCRKQKGFTQAQFQKDRSVMSVQKGSAADSPIVG